MRYLFFSLLVISAIGLFAVPQAFADHDEITIQNAQGSSTPGCEETADGCFIPNVVVLAKADTEVTWENNDTAAHTAKVWFSNRWTKWILGQQFDHGRFIIH